MTQQHYFYGTGRRKTSVARVRLYPGTGAIVMGLIGMVVSAVIIFGAIQMMGLRTHGLAMAASILLSRWSSGAASRSRRITTTPCVCWRISSTIRVEICRETDAPPVMLESMWRRFMWHPLLSFRANDLMMERSSE